MSQERIFEDSYNDQTEDLIAKYLSSDSQSVFAPIPRTSSIYSSEEGFKGKMRQGDTADVLVKNSKGPEEPASVSNATVDGLGTSKKEEHEESHEPERLETRELDHRRPTTQIPLSSFSPLGNGTQDQGLNADERKIPASDRGPLTKSEKDESRKKKLEGVRQKREAYVPSLKSQLQKGKHENRLTQIPCGEDIVPLGLTNTTDRKRKRYHKNAGFDGASQSQ
jgi:hypothetical protein